MKNVRKHIDIKLIAREKRRNYLVLKPKYGEKAKLCYMDTENFIVYLKTDSIYKDIAEDV